MPREDGTISSVALAREEANASTASVEAANDYCKERTTQAVFIDQQTEYQGVLTDHGKIARVVKKIPVVGDEISSDDDYRVTTRFKCVAEATPPNPVR